MNTTPSGSRKNIAIYGNSNVGKSSLLNRLVEQEVSLVSEIEGTTTDPVYKAMELLPVGPVLFIDTAGLKDTSELGKMRVKKTIDITRRTDIAIYVVDANNIDEESLENMKLYFKKYNINYITVVNKIDEVTSIELNEIKKIYNNAVYVSAKDGIGISKLKESLICKLKNDEIEVPIIGDLLQYNDNVILVVPIDSEAPKGRLILPQVQCIRECLDYGIKTCVVRDSELQSALNDFEKVDLVVTDSQAFKRVEKIVPSNIKLTSFSTLFARHKGDIKYFVEGVRSINKLTKESKILIAESCTHNVSHEDIGRVKIPTMLNNYIGEKLTYHYTVGYDFPEDITKYDLVIHCGACMINRKTVLNRIQLCKDADIPITNYGIIMAFLTGILNRNLEIFNI